MPNKEITVISISEKYRSFLDILKEKNALGFELLDNKDVFLLAVSLGLNNPTNPQKKFGFIRKTYIKTSEKALFGSVLLGTAITDDEVNQSADFEKSIELCEKCAEAGFKKLKEKYDNADCDIDLLERRMLKDLDLLYTQNIENDI